MQKYINMNDSFGGKYTVSSTKSFQTNSTQYKNKLQQQIQYYQNALKTAEKLMQNYQQENKRLTQDNKKALQENQKIRENLFVEKQKYSVLEHLFMKFNNQKDKQLMKLSNKSHENYLQKEIIMRDKHEKQIQKLSKKIVTLETKLSKYQKKNRQRIIQTDRDQIDLSDSRRETFTKFRTTIEKDRNRQSKNPQIIVKISLETDPHRNKHSIKSRNQKLEYQTYKTEQQSLQKYMNKSSLSIKNRIPTNNYIFDSPDNKGTIKNLDKYQKKHENLKNENLQKPQKQYRKLY